MTHALNRSIPFWILLAASAGLTAAGVLVVLDHLGTMTTTLKNGSATGLEVYAGQSWIVIGAALLGAGALGVLLTLALPVIATLLGVAMAKPVEFGPLPFDEADEDMNDPDPEGALDAPAAAHEIVVESSSPAEQQEQPAETSANDAQNGSSGSTATATKISVR